MPDGSLERRPARRSPAAPLNDPRRAFPAALAEGRSLSPHEDFYHWVLTRTWPQFFGAVTAAFAVTNALFALLYMASPGCVSNATGFFDHFFFSVETLSTVGYGEMAPQTAWSHAIVTVQALLGLLATAVVTGLTFARFARPQARILFSEKAVICERDGVPHLMFRMANWRRNLVAEAQLSVSILVAERTKEGESMRRPVPLALVREKNPMFALTWTAMHPVTPGSPFYGEGALEALRAMRAEIFCTLSGLDETLMQTIVARFRYGLDDIVANARFADILTLREDGTRVVDYDRFHEVIPFEEGQR